MTIKSVTAKVKNNAIGAVVGAGASYWAVKKYTSISGTWKIVGIALLGAVAGAYGQSMISARISSPKAKDTKK